MHGSYDPKVERVDVAAALSGTRGTPHVGGEDERFPLVVPSTMPMVMLDPTLLRFVHKNAISNACKYGRTGGVVVTEVCHKRNEITMRVTNEPGPFHEALTQMGSAAESAVFEPGRQLHPDLGTVALGNPPSHTHSSGDGAWIMKKCAKTLGGDCSIVFEESKTVFSLTCPAKPVSTFKRKLSLDDQDILLKDDDIANFCLPSNTFGVSIDDSKVQRKLLAKMLDMCGVRKDKTLILGETRQEIVAFETTVAKLIRDNPHDLILAIIDENLDVDRDGDPQTVSGSRCIERLRKLLAPEEEARLLALIRSANDSKEDITLYNSRAHGYLPKGPIKKESIFETIAPLWIKKFGKCNTSIENL